MSLSAGEKLGPYEILSQIGAGGMGEVYRARDTRLGREVALKVSAQQFSERFEREARVIASLNHPNICTLHDVGPNYLVMELVDGPTLADRIKQGPIALQESLDIARQIADALDTAHEKGIVHRDLKPGNIKIKPDGVVKVLDFGLAKTGGTPTIQSDNSPTISMAMTEAGMILGTASYMSPEQAKGKSVDKRADIYAFGAVLYEMLTGKRLHSGETTTEVLASVIKEEATWENVPRQVHRLLQRCLEKDPQKRLRHIGDVMALLDESPAAGTSLMQIPSQRRSWLWPALASALIVALGAAGWEWWRTTRFTDLPLIRHDADVGSDLALPPPVPWITNVVISPDGTRIAFIANPASGGFVRLYTRRLDQPKPIELPGTQGASGPFFSPDGHWIGFASAGKLLKISVDGGAVVPLMELKAPFQGASWGQKEILVGQVGAPLTRIPATGGLQSSSLEFAPGEILQTSPQILPGGKAALIAANTTGTVDTATIDVISLVDHKRKNLVRGGAFPRYVPSFSSGMGHVLYTVKGALYAFPFDAEKLEMRGNPIPMLDDVNGTQLSAGKFDVSQTGTLVYQKLSGPLTTGYTVQWLDSAGKMKALVSKPGVYETPKLSPDGKRLALVVTAGSGVDVEVYDWESDRTTKITFGGPTYLLPLWSQPDGRYLVFGSNAGIFWARSDGSGQPQRLIPSNVKSQQVPWSFSPDGKHLAFLDSSLGIGIWIVPIEEQNGELKAGTPERFLNSGVTAAFSPDGKWLAYRSGDTGSDAIYVRPYPPSSKGGQWVISTHGGSSPVWSRSSRELFYLGSDGLMVSNYSVKGDTFVADAPKLWAKLNPDMFLFDLSPDAKRAVIAVPVQSGEKPRIEHEVVFLENFFDELRRRVPVAK